jgi:hypothetical protein
MIIQQELLTRTKTAYWDDCSCRTIQNSVEEVEQENLLASVICTVLPLFTCEETFILIQLPLLLVQPLFIVTLWFEGHFHRYAIYCPFPMQKKCFWRMRIVEASKCHHHFRSRLSSVHCEYMNELSPRHVRAWHVVTRLCLSCCRSDPVPMILSCFTIWCH